MNGTTYYETYLLRTLLPQVTMAEERTLEDAIV